MFKKLKNLLIIVLLLAAISLFIGGIYYSYKYSQGREEIFTFYLGIVYGIVASIFIAMSFVVIKFFILNIFLMFNPQIDFDELRIPILIVEIVMFFIFLISISFLLPLKFSQL